MPDTPADIASNLPDTLVLWDVDHTLIENGGVSKATYAGAFELLTGQRPAVRPTTDGRTDFQIMHELLAANSVDVEKYSDTTMLADVLVTAMKQNSPDLPQRGYVLPGVLEALRALSTAPTVVQSALTGNVFANACAKLEPFGLDGWLDLDVGGFGSDDIVRSNLVGAAQRKAFTKYGTVFDRSSTVLVGDTERDVQAAHDGGARIIAVATGVYSVDQLVNAGADVVLDDLSGLGRFLTTLAKLRAEAAPA